MGIKSVWLDILIDWVCIETYVNDRINIKIYRLSENRRERFKFYITFQYCV